jgi:ABC-type multidrug transport system ATPase subunit
MRIVLENTGRRFNRDWIFRHLDYEIASESQALIVGRNGSGKSTLLQIISGFLSASEGQVQRFSGSGEPLDDPALHMSLASPYLDLYDQLTLEEAITFQQTFRRFRGDKSVNEVIELSELAAHRTKRIRNFSSGMRQRLRLTLAILADSSLLCLDEPTSNLDKDAVQWYRNLLSAHLEHRTVIVSSNHQPDDYLAADMTIDLSLRK